MSRLSIRPAWWQWPTVLSLDAPLVCLLWQALLARVVRIDLPWPHAFVLTASVWLAYGADRWLEGFRLDLRMVRTQRHQFYLRYRWPFSAAWIAVLTADVAIALTMLEQRAVVRGTVLLVPVLAYVLSHQTLHRDRPWRVPKEIVIAVLLTAGVALFVVPAQQSPQPIASLAAFGLVSFVNCVLISLWEREVDTSHGQTSLALQTRHHAGFIKALPWITAAFGVAALPLAPGSERVAVTCGTASALLLAVVDRFEPVVGWPKARVLADIALMTPALALLLPA